MALTEYNTWSTYFLPKVAVKQFGKPVEKKKDDSKDPNSTSNRTLRAAKILERMINQNTFDDIAKGTYRNHFCTVESISRSACLSILLK